MTWGRTVGLTMVAATWPLTAMAGQVSDGRAEARLAAPVDRPVYRTVDPIAQTELAVYRPGAEETLIEARAEGVTVRRRIRGMESLTEIVTPAERLTVDAGRDRVVLLDGRSRLEARRGDRAGSDAIRAAVVQSSAYADALDGLARIARGASGPAAHLVLSARMALATLRGERPMAPVIRPTRVDRRIVARPMAVAVAHQQMTPGECWDVYAADAIEIYMEYEDCVDNEQWWDVVGLGSCAAIYSLQASGAFSWWLNCTAIRG